MKARHLFLTAAIAVVAAGFLVTCSPTTTPVSIDQRINDFQADLNNATRTSAYLNFHPTMTSDYDALKDGSTITTLFPLVTGTPYTLTVTDENNPTTTGVLVTQTGGPGVSHNLILVMATYSDVDWRIVSLSKDNGSGTFPGTPQIK